MKILPMKAYIKAQLIEFKSYINNISYYFSCQEGIKTEKWLRNQFKNLGKK